MSEQANAAVDTPAPAGTPASAGDQGTPDTSAPQGNPEGAGLEQSGRERDASGRFIKKDGSAEPAKAGDAPIEYSLKLPDTPTLTPDAVERSVAFAKAHGLSNAVAQEVLAYANTEAATIAGKATETATQKLLADWSPGDASKGVKPGAEWQKQAETWHAQALSDPALGNGDPKTLDQRTALAQTAFKAVDDPEFTRLLETSGYGNNPIVLRYFAKLGERMQEGQPVNPGAPATGALTTAEIFYGSK